MKQINASVAQHHEIQNKSNETHARSQTNRCAYLLGCWCAGRSSCFPSLFTTWLGDDADAWVGEYHSL